MFNVRMLKSLFLFYLEIHYTSIQLAEQKRKSKYLNRPVSYWEVRPTAFLRYSFVFGYFLRDQLTPFSTYLLDSVEQLFIDLSIYLI